MGPPPLVQDWVLLLRLPAGLDESFNDGVGKCGVGNKNAAVVVAGLEVGAHGKVAVQRGFGFRTPFQVPQHRRPKAQMKPCFMLTQCLVNRHQRLVIPPLP